MSWKIWMLVPIVYGLFSLWYFNWKGPLTTNEIDRLMARHSSNANHYQADVMQFIN